MGSSIPQVGGSKLVLQLSALAGLIGILVLLYFFVYLDGRLPEAEAQRIAQLGILERHPMALVAGLALVVGGFGTAAFAATRTSAQAPAKAAAAQAQAAQAAAASEASAGQFRCKVCGDFGAKRATIFHHVRSVHDKTATEAQDLIEAI